MLQTIVLGAHVFIAMGIIGLVLLQRGKGADAGTGFGAGASGTVFGARGSSNFLSHATAVLATLFFVTSLGLAYLATQRTAPESLLERGLQTTPQATPVPQSPSDELPDVPEPAIDEPPPLPADEQGAASTDEDN
jgi:preprotein translocase subunit SecG